MLNFTQRLQDVFEYIGLAVQRIFSGNTDQYPETGVQPYEGDPKTKTPSE